MKNIITILLILVSTNSFAKDKIGLLIIAHGSPSKQWNQPVLNIENNVKSLLKEKQITDFDEVRVALMEFTEPSISTVVKEMEDKGITRIYALPLFIAPSGHSVYDVPTILGVYYNKQIANAIKAEGTKIVNSKTKITVGPSLYYKDVIKDILLERVQELSKDPQNEALVILAHGDKDFYPSWEGLANEVGNYILAKTGIEYFNKAFVEVGQSFATNGVSSILNAYSQKDKVIVVGMYLSLGVKNMPKKSGILMMGHTIDGQKMLEGINISYSDKGLLPSKKITEWIVERGSEWIKQ